MDPRNQAYFKYKDVFASVMLNLKYLQNIQPKISSGKLTTLTRNSGKGTEEITLDTVGFGQK